MKYYFFSGFEVGGVENFTSASGSSDAPIAKKGLYAGKLDNNENFLKTLATGQTTVYMSGWFRWTVDLASDWYVMLGDGPANGQYQVKTHTGGHLKVYIDGNATWYTETTSNLIKNTWYFIEFKFVMHDTTGSFELRVDGENVLSQTGIDTKNVDATVETFKWQGINTTGNCYVDDCAVTDSWADDYGIVVTKTGIDVEDASVHQQKFGSSWDNLKIKQEKYNSITTDVSGDGSATIAHSLGYKPAFMTFAYKATTNTLDSVSFSNANFISGSGQFTPFYYDTSGVNQSLRDIVSSSDTSNINLTIDGANSKNYKMYTYVLADLAEETAHAPAFSGNDYGMRISQKGYSAKTDQDYRMIYSSKYASFGIAKTGTLSFDLPEVTLNDGEEDLQYVSATFADLGISAGYHPYMIMLSDIDISSDSPSYIWLDEGYVPWLPFTGSPERISHAGAFCTNDRIVFYGWRSYTDWGSGASATFGSIDSSYFACRYMIFKETMTFS